MSATQEDDRINLRVLLQDGSDAFFLIKRNSRLIKLMNAYCNLHSVGIQTIVFLFNGRRVRGNQTPDELEMDDGDEIDAMLHQTGGGASGLNLLCF